jgi:hypothetical protein
VPHKGVQSLLFHNESPIRGETFVIRNSGGIVRDGIDTLDDLPVACGFWSAICANPTSCWLAMRRCTIADAGKLLAEPSYERKQTPNYSHQNTKSDRNRVERNQNSFFSTHIVPPGSVDFFDHFEDSGEEGGKYHYGPNRFLTRH